MSVLDMDIACASVTFANLITDLHPYGCFFYCRPVVSSKFVDAAPINITIFIQHIAFVLLTHSSLVKSFASLFPKLYAHTPRKVLRRVFRLPCFLVPLGHAVGHTRKKDSVHLRSLTRFFAFSSFQLPAHLLINFKRFFA